MFFELFNPSDLVLQSDCHSVQDFHFSIQHFHHIVDRVAATTALLSFVGLNA
jgi:hypothetical protein